MKKVVLFIIIVSIVLAIGISTAFACKGYGTRTYYGTSTKIYASLTRCSCLPVNNYLYTSTRGQYLSGDQYYWTNWKEVYGTNVASRSSSTTGSNFVFGYCHFRHSCATGGSAYTYYQFNVYP